MRKAMFALVAMTSLAFVNCDGGTRIRGIVRDSGDLSLEGVTVTLAWNGEKGEALKSFSVVTKQDGE